MCASRSHSFAAPGVCLGEMNRPKGGCDHSSILIPLLFPWFRRKRNVLCDWILNPSHNWVWKSHLLRAEVLYEMSVRPSEKPIPPIEEIHAQKHMNVLSISGHPSGLSLHGETPEVSDPASRKSLGSITVLVRYSGPTCRSDVGEVTFARCCPTVNGETARCALPLLLYLLHRLYRFICALHTDRPTLCKKGSMPFCSIKKPTGISSECLKRQGHAPFPVR